MIHPDTFSFLRSLKKNNNKDWYEAHKPQAVAATANVAAMTDALIAEVAAFDGHVAAAELEGKKCLSRLHRDVRFSKDKSPYKANFFAFINRGGKKAAFAGYYLHIEPGACFAGGGVYMPMPNDLLAFRREIDYNPKEWRAIVESKAFLKMFPEGVQTPEKLSRAPKDFDADSEVVEYLKHKGFYTMKNFSDEEMLSGKAVKEVAKVYKAIEPMVAFLNGGLE